MSVKSFGTTFILALGLCSTLAMPALAGTYLPDEDDLPKAVDEIDPQTSSTHIIKDYVGDLVQYNRDVFCADETVGTIDFEYAAYTGRRASDPIGSTTIGGAAIRGGFVLNPGYAICDGHEIRWIQTYEENDSGTQVVDGNPFYPNFPIAGVAAALYDVPFDLLTVDIKVAFESALVCIEQATGNVSVLGSFFWGYEISNGVVTAMAPSLWGTGVTQGWITAVSAHDYFADDSHDLATDGDCCVCEVPEPATASAMALLGAALLGRPRRRAAA